MKRQFGHTFCMVVTLVTILIMTAYGVILKYHLTQEQEWSSSLQKMVDTDLMVISAQNKYIDDLHDFILSLPKE